MELKGEWESEGREQTAKAKRIKQIGMVAQEHVIQMSKALSLDAVLCISAGKKGAAGADHPSLFLREEQV